MAPREWAPGHERLVVFLAVLVAAGGISLIAEYKRSPAFDTAIVYLKDGDVISRSQKRYYVTTTSASVVLIAYADRCPAIEAVPRDEIKRITIGPERVVIDPDKDDPAEPCGSQRRHPVAP